MYSSFACYYNQIFPYHESVSQLLSKQIHKSHSKILDIGCATGEYIGRLGLQPHLRTGIDLSREMITLAARKYPRTRFFVKDMRRVDELEGNYDLSFCIGNTAAYLPPEQYGSFLAKIRNLLRPDGTWIVQVMNWDYILQRKTFSFPVISTENKSIKFFRRYLNITKKELLFETRLELNGKTIFMDEATMYPTISNDWIRMHESEGFSLNGHFAGFSETSFNPDCFSANIFVFRLMDQDPDKTRRDEAPGKNPDTA